MLVSIVLIDARIRSYDERSDVEFRLCIELSVEARLMLHDMEQFFHLKLEVRFSLIENLYVFVVHRVPCAFDLMLLTG